MKGKLKLNGLSPPTDPQVPDSDRADIWRTGLHQESLQGQKTQGDASYQTNWVPMQIYFTNANILYKYPTTIIILNWLSYKAHRLYK